MAEKLIKRGGVWYYRFTDADGRRVMRKGCPDRRATEEMAAAAKTMAGKIRDGYVDPKDVAYRDHEALSLDAHLDAWVESLRSKGTTRQRVKLHASRAARVVALMKGAKLSDIEAPKPATREGVARAEAGLRKCVASSCLSDLTTERVQNALGRLRSEGRSLATCNHHRAAVKQFVKWCYDTHRIREDALRGVVGFNAKEDPRHERRTISLDELRCFIQAAQRGEPFKSMTGPTRALCYRLAVASGLRYSEIASILPESFDWKAPGVTVAAAHAKNGNLATLPLPIDLVDDLAAYVAPLPPGKPIFPLPHDKGAAMVRRDLKAAGIPYQDAAGLFFDFHSLRCELATLADAVAVSPRVVQRMMRHSKLEMTGRYTMPRVVDLENATGLLSSLKPEGDRPEALAATGTDGDGRSTHKQPLAPYLLQIGDGSSRLESVQDVIIDSDAPSCMVRSSLENEALDASIRLESVSSANDRGGTRTLDQRINLPHRLSPTIASSIRLDLSRRAEDST
ncbi:MAG: tyrosine-type recombinase/integrase [Isosphaerales bacterium]